jgi:hypothetical protein
VTYREFAARKMDICSRPAMSRRSGRRGRLQARSDLAKFRNF